MVAHHLKGYVEKWWANNWKLIFKKFLLLFIVKLSNSAIDLKVVIYENLGRYGYWNKSIKRGLREIKFVTPFGDQDRVKCNHDIN